MKDKQGRRTSSSFIKFANEIATFTKPALMGKIWRKKIGEELKSNERGH